MNAETIFFNRKQFCDLIVKQMIKPQDQINFYDPTILLHKAPNTEGGHTREIFL